MLTEKQKEAYETLSAWLHDSGNLLAKLKGYAGTGKTFLIKYLIEDARKIRVRKFDPEIGETVEKSFAICVTAPTHQAKKVIQKASGCPGRTIQSLLGLAPNTDIENFDINNPAFEVKNNPSMPKYDLVVIDEGSMCATGLKDLIIDTAFKHGVKVLFVYDAAQLAPVGEDIIPVDKDPRIHISEELTDIIRTDNSNPILSTYTSIRNNLTSSKDTFSHKSRISEDRSCGEIYFKDLKDFEVRAVKRFWTLFNEGKVTSDKILAWTNNAVSKWNNLIRNSIRNALGYEDRMSKFFFKGEPLVSFSTLDKTIIVNSEEYRLENPEFITRVWEYFKRDEKGKVINPTEPEKIEIEYIEGTLYQFDDDLSPMKVQFVVPEEANYKKFVTLFYWFHSLGVVDRRWKSYYEWKDQNMLIKDLKAKNGLLCRKDFDYSYAVSIHKSQGSTYTNIYVDERDIDQLEQYNFVRFLYDSDLKKQKTKFQKAKFMKEYPNFESYYKKQQVFKNRLKYVAMTRPTKFMVMLTNK